MKATFGGLMLLPQFLLHSAVATNLCRCLSTDSCWPSPSDFAELASGVSQPLLAPVSPASTCYPASSLSGNCSMVQASWQDGNWRSDQPGAMQSPNFETFIFANGTIDACYLNTTLGAPCDQGSVPVVGVDARYPEDVQAAVKFAATHNLRVAVKNTGHDYFGRSTARGAFLIWTHHLKNITFHDSFTPDGAPPSVTYANAVTLGSGVQWHEAYDFVAARNRTLVGGLSPGGSVGAAGGWVQGGGHSALAPKYGLGVDNVVQMTVVTSTGDYLTTNAHQNPDLFWALRGGGGGTYGVVISVTYQTHPSTPLIAAFFTSSINSTASKGAMGPTPVLRELFTEFVRQTPALADGGWSGYSLITPGNAGNAPSLQFAFIAVNISWETANATMLPFFDFAAELAANSSSANNLDNGVLAVDTAVTSPLPSFTDWVREFFANATGEVGSNTELGSRLLPRDLIETKPKDVADALLSIPGMPQYYLVAGGAVAKADPASTGLNPAWRMALVHTVFGTTWREGASAEDIEAARQVLKDGEARLRALSPDSGAYFNEASLYEDDFKTTFFGSHYDKLRAIKQQYDPIDLFIVAEGVGSDEWDKELNCRV